MALQDVYNSGRIRAYWALDEASGTRLDRIGNHNAQVSGSVATSTGKFADLAADFEDSTSDKLVVAHHANLNIPASGQLTIGGWWRPNDKTVTANIFSKWAFPTDLVYSIQAVNLGGPGPYQFRVLIGNATGDNTGFVVTHAASNFDGTYYFLIVEIDEVNDVVTIERNRSGKVTDSTSLTYTLVDGTSDLWIGADEAGGNYGDGAAQGWAVIEGLLTTPEKDEWYNSGSGFDLNELITFPTGMGHYNRLRRKIARYGSAT